MTISTQNKTVSEISKEDISASKKQNRHPLRKQTSKLISEYLQSDPNTSTIFEKIQRHARGIVISGYDLTNRCNLRCEGCFFFEGQLSHIYHEEKTEEEYNEFFRQEQARGVNYVHFAGAEPALVQERLHIANKYWNRGLIYTNGTILIDPAITFMIHISLWGAPKTDERLRGAPVFQKAVKNYAGDPRAIIMMTISKHSIDQILEVAQICEDTGMLLSFNHFSPSRKYMSKLCNDSQHNPKSNFRFSTSKDNLILEDQDLKRIADSIGEAMIRWPKNIIYSSYYNHWINQPGSRFQIDPETKMATDCPILNMPYHREYHVDLSYDDRECCIANIDCYGCRHYVSGYTKMMAERHLYLNSLKDFKGWVETFNTWCRLHFINWDKLL
ncbi:MAG: hypothetical protein HQK65_05930 [Desulfamplus sp.]|nr:hypothetical protein [Desulfamplus sp.]